MGVRTAQSAGRPRGRAGLAPVALPAALVLSGAVSVQAGAGIADRLFGQVPPAAVTTLRLWAAALIMVAIGWRGAARAVADLIGRRAFRDAAATASFGIALAVMNFSIYQAIERIPLGVAVTVEFLGPLAVAVAGAGPRRPASLAWAGLAAVGVLLLAQGSAGRLDLAGVAFALVSAAGWAGYILLSRATGQRFSGSSGLVIAMCVAAVLVTGPGVAAGAPTMFRLPVLATGAAVGLLSSVIPYWLEFEALRRVAARVFGVWMSVQPAVAALIGLAMLGQRLSPAEWAGICCVVVASACAARGALRGITMEAVSSWLARVTAAVLRPAQATVRGFALAAVISNAVIISTGEAVRLSSSGLGCPDWPQCTKASVVAAHSVGQTMLNTWIEFGNRLLNFPLVAIAGLAFIVCWQYRQDGRRRRDLVWLSAALPLGVIAQAVVGGIVVLTRLNPAMVAVHYLLSSAILAAAVVLHVRVDEGAGPARSLVRTDLRVLAGLLVAVTALMLAAGTVVTGTGPLAGTVIDSDGHRTTVPRFHFALESVTQLHADIGWFIGALAVALVIGLRYSTAPRAAVRLGWVVLIGLGVQGVIGYVQYFNHLPAGLVWVHVVVSVLLWICVLRLYLATRERTAEPAGPGGAPAPAVPVTEELPAR
ncbi:COX15/CtaA family protein [Trebonia sp.]|uniref:COX15/CtaA family protein n=1 Tax=Trebonia sp. TaxID=2767075 RepID=UPI00261DADC3|nr:COX15/CtaA family protein [Trebonia sp.]